jgi:replicative DNA helicase
MTSHELTEATEAKNRLAEIPIHIEEKPGITLSELRNHARKLSRKEGQLSCIVIDYLQIMGGAEDDRVQAIGKITRSLKALARELNCPVILLSQLSRGVEARTNKRPLMSDLRDSGSIEQDADLIVMMYREEYYDPDTPDRGVAELIIVKHRNGPTGTVKLLFQPEYNLFLNRGQSNAH